MKIMSTKKFVTGKNYFLVRTAMTVLAVGFIKSSTAADLDFKCTNPDEFFYATPKTHCSSYYKCYQRQRIKFDCTSGTVFDFYKQKCSRSAGVCYEPVCTGRTNGVYQDTTHACRRSYTCRGGQLISVDNCPYGHLHNGDSCQPQEYVTCDQPETTAVAYPYAGDKRCLGLNDGNHGVQDDECRKYIVCHNSEVHDETQCPHGLRFDSVTRRCKVAHEVSCSNSENTDICYHMSDGYHLDPLTGDCRAYFRCANGQMTSKHTCGPQTVFNGKTCVPNPLYECPISATNQNDICHRHSDGMTINPRKGCAHYVKCSNGKTVQHYECSKGYYFEPDKKHCVFERHNDNKKCRPAQNSAECRNLESGQFYQDKSTRSSCREYFFCYNGNRTNFKCGAGMIFNGEICIDNKLYTCPNNDLNSCDGKSDGYFKDKSGGCRAYYYCSNGKKFSYLCGEFQYFDGAKCTERKATQMCGSNACAGKSDGYYPDLKTNCRSYYFCARGEKATSITCRGNKIFNGSSCVNQDSFSCSSEGNTAVSSACVQRKCYRSECKKDGFYADIDSNCKNYYFCIAGKKTYLSCTDGFVFNGEICVPSESYQCPKYCTNSVKC